MEVDDGDAPSRLLYHAGMTLRIREHVPPRPFTGDYGPSPRPPVDWTRWEGLANWEIGRVEFALANPPIETEVPGEVERTLTLTGTKTRGTGGGSNVVTCSLDGDESVEYVAKIYDGADYPLGRDNYGIECMTWADRDYSTEAWAYKIMQPLIGGTIVPAYHGSWTFALDTHQPGQQRWVRMILMELIHGECMLDIILRANDGYDRLDRSLLPPEEFHNDPRNVMVKPDGTVVLIDFNQVYINKFSCYDLKHPKEGNPAALAPSIIERGWPLPCGFADDVNNPWKNWVPKAWLDDQELAAEWLISTYRNSSRFSPPSQQFLDDPFHSRSSRKIVKLLEELGRKAADDAVSPSQSE